MAHSWNSQGYRCEFRDAVNEHFYCSKCSLVARKIVLTSCCGEGYCSACIADVLQQGKPCQACGEHIFTTIKPMKYRREMESLLVYCSMKGRGCGWSGTLGELDMHLDPDQDNCQYVDTKCPLNCQQTIPKNRVEQHVAEECARRDFTCQHCAFKASYEEVMDIHLPECKYVPLQCPNLCGVTCERENMEDHMKMCRLEEVACEFSDVGCVEKSTREDLEEHTRKNIQKHLALTAASTNRENLQLQLSLVKQEQKFQEIFEDFDLRLKEQKTKVQTLELQLGKEEKILVGQEQGLDKLTKLLQNQDIQFTDMLQKTNEKLKVMELKCDQQQSEHAILEDKLRHSENMVEKIEKYMFGRRKFAMNNFNEEKMKDETDDWKSPALYTHSFGYKFCIGIDANGFGPIRGEAIRVELWSMEGEFDSQLKWPAAVTITIELVNQNGGESAWHTGGNIQLNQVTSTTSVFVWERIDTEGFIEHSKLGDFLKDDTLYFNITECTVH